ncbi:hypothetical protein JTE90_014165 [Oedothorax gibbosus]|uniref:Cytosol aminopeptidase n=1 Tax=Oedothorax gibbosus TaxID=931172 RepID=A0AAV6VLQ2_9ARAC|nr:hypothetical protein JTE90_014165 [Oedothorax gibbosus]
MRLTTLPKEGIYYIRKRMKGLVLGVYTRKTDHGGEIAELTDSFKDVDQKCKGKLTSMLQSTGPFCKSVNHKLLWVSMLKECQINIDFDCISVVDLGSKETKVNPIEGRDEKAERVRCAIANGVRALRSSSDFENIYLDPCDSPRSAAEASNLSLYTYDTLKAESSKRPKSLLHLYKYAEITNEDVTNFNEGAQVAVCQNFSRRLMETPANYMTPSHFVSTVIDEFKGSDVKLIVREEEWIKEKGMGSFLSVARGSDEKPKFLELHYEGAPGLDKCIAFVGKGITFDSGGISIKPSLDMDKMRADMGGAACVVSTILGASLLKLKVNVKGFIPLCENMPSGKATKPGDVVVAMNGKTIQVDNTDAEGRLILADGLCYAQQFKPMAVLDIATLTGAIGIALGSGATGVFSTDDNLWNTLQKAGSKTGDRVWRMPLFKLYKKGITKSCRLADVNNLGASRKAGSCTAAAFLHEFIEPDMKWLHLDIAGVMEDADEAPYGCKGMSGRPTRTVVQFLKELEGSDVKPRTL